MSRPRPPAALAAWLYDTPTSRTCTPKETGSASTGPLTPRRGGARLRLHQEDTAQALGLDISDQNRKFQRGKKLPSLRAIAQVLRNGGQEPDDLLRLTTLNLAISNSDAHAKNISLLRRPDGDATLAPAYDIAVHAHHGTYRGVFAMDVNGRSEMDALTADDLIAEGVSWKLPARRSERAVRQTLMRLQHALGAIDRNAFPGVPSQAWRAVEGRTAALLGSLPP